MRLKGYIPYVWDINDRSNRTLSTQGGSMAVEAEDSLLNILEDKKWGFQKGRTIFAFCLCSLFCCFSSSLPGTQWERIAVIKISPQNIYYTLYATKAMAVRYPARSELRREDTDWANIPELITGSSHFTSFQAIDGCVFAHCQEVHEDSTTGPCCRGKVHVDCVKTNTQGSLRFVNGDVGCPVCSRRAAKAVQPPAPTDAENQESSLEQQLETLLGQD